MISPDHEHGNATVTSPHHLLAEEQTRVVIRLVAVVEITHDHHEGEPFHQGQVDQILNCPPCRSAALDHRGPLLTVKPALRTVKMNVGSIKKPEHERAPGMLPVARSSLDLTGPTTMLAWIEPQGIYSSVQVSDRLANCHVSRNKAVRRLIKNTAARHGK